ncbi:small acid-soluble spore protein P [Paenibacillus sp. y28]|uniref:small acid-soluble spore protein P n=1 Tax=Paenibacillus sp. y28 TaxID=3129110 RepID=UPI0030172BB8
MTKPVGYNTGSTNEQAPPRKEHQQQPLSGSKKTKQRNHRSDSVGEGHGHT